MKDFLQKYHNKKTISNIGIVLTSLVLAFWINFLLIIGLIDAIWTFTSEVKPKGWEVTTAALSVGVPILLGIFVYRIEHNYFSQVACLN